jgi:hypothetical protein
MTPYDANQLDDDGGEDTVCAQGEATAHQEAAAGASRDGSSAIGGDATTSQGKQEGGAMRCNMTTRRRLKRLRHDKKPCHNKPGKWEVMAH